jgi:hypothetical protein
VTRLLEPEERAHRPMRQSDSIDACRVRGCGGYLRGVGTEVSDGEAAWCGTCGREHTFTICGDGEDSSIYVSPVRAERVSHKDRLPAVADLRYDLLRHALGVRQTWDRRRWSLPYRNRFVAGGDHLAAWEALTAAGMAEKRGAPSELTGGDQLFVVTEEGRSMAMEGLVPRKRWAYGTPQFGVA